LCTGGFTLAASVRSPGSDRARPLRVLHVQVPVAGETVGEDAQPKQSLTRDRMRRYRRANAQHRKSPSRERAMSAPAWQALFAEHERRRVLRAAFGRDCRMAVLALRRAVEPGASCKQAQEALSLTPVRR
jgi:hypothetical protein